MISLATNIPVTGTYAGVGALAGTPYAVPFGRGVERFITVAIVFGADPGLYVFNLMASNDGVTFVPFDTQITGTTVNIIVKKPTARFIRVDQVSKANAVTATVTINLN